MLALMWCEVEAFRLWENIKLQHWRGFQVIFALRGAPVLEFAYKFKELCRTGVGRYPSSVHVRNIDKTWAPACAGATYSSID